MQVMGVTGKIYGMKSGQTANGKDKVSFRVGVRKQFVTDQDKQNNTTMTFMPISAMGPTAGFITKHFKDGDMISLGDMEYQTYRSQNADPSNNFDDMHIFKVNRAGFVSDGNAGNGGNGAQRQQPQGNQQPQQNYQQPNQGYQAPNQQPNQQPVGAGVGGNTPFDPGYSPSDDLPF